MQNNTQFDWLPHIYHILRAAYQAGIVWGQSLEATTAVHYPEQWVWQKKLWGDGTYTRLIHVQFLKVVLNSVNVDGKKTMQCKVLM